MKYRAGVIGCGRMGSIFEDMNIRQAPCTHAGIYDDNKKTNLVTASDTCSSRLKNFTERWNIKNVYHDYHDMLEKENLDILSICTHAQNHREICMNACESGVRAIFCEKPIATNLREADEMINICKKKRVVLAVNYTRRWDAYFNNIKYIIEHGEIGNIETMVCHTAAGLLNNGTHMFDLMRYYSGDVLWLTGQIRYDDSTDPNGVGMLRFENGAYGLVETGFRDYPLHGVNIIGSRGMIRGTGMMNVDNDFEILKNEGNKYIKVFHEMGTKKPKGNKIPELDVTKPVLETIDCPRRKSPISVALVNIINCMENGGKPKCSGEDGRAALEIALAFSESERNWGKSVLFPMSNRDLRVIPRETSITKDGAMVI